MLSDVCLSDVCRVHPIGGRRVRPAGWMARIGWSGRARPAWLKAAATRFRCRPGRGISWRPPAYSLFASKYPQENRDNLVEKRLGVMLLYLCWLICLVLTSENILLTVVGVQRWIESRKDLTQEFMTLWRQLYVTDGSLCVAAAASAAAAANDGKLSRWRLDSSHYGVSIRRTC